MKVAKKEGKRIPLNMRTTATLRDKMKKAANGSGRSLAQEVEARLEQTFAAESHAKNEFGGQEKYQIFRMLSAASEAIQFRTGKSWLTDEDTATSVNSVWQILINELLPNLSPEIVSEKILNASPLTPIPEIPEIPSHPFMGTFASRLAKMSGGDIEKDNKELEKANEAYNAAMKDYAQQIKKIDTATNKNKVILERQEQQIAEWLENFRSTVSEGIDKAHALFPPRS
jgi:hypothetical protein